MYVIDVYNHNVISQKRLPEMICYMVVKSNKALKKSKGESLPQLVRPAEHANVKWSGKILHRK